MWPTMTDFSDSRAFRVDSGPSGLSGVDTLPGTMSQTLSSSVIFTPNSTCARVIASASVPAVGGLSPLASMQ